MRAQSAEDPADPSTEVFWENAGNFYYSFQGLINQFSRVGFTDPAELFLELSKALRGKHSVQDQVCAAFGVYVSRISQSPPARRG